MGGSMGHGDSLEKLLNGQMTEYTFFYQKLNKMIFSQIRPYKHDFLLCSILRSFIQAHPLNDIFDI